VTDGAYYLTRLSGSEGAYYLTRLSGGEGTYYMSRSDTYGGGPFSIEISLDVKTYDSCYGNTYRVWLDPGSYELIPSGGATNDAPDVGNYWAWNIATTAGSFNGGYTLETSPPTGSYAASAEAAFASVQGMSLPFAWAGRYFELWIPSNDPPNNTNAGSLSVVIKST
jgi:hypothetical protein